MSEEWPGPRERRTGVPEQRELFPEAEKTEPPTCYCCGDEAVGQIALVEWGLEVDVCEDCLGLKYGVASVDDSGWKELVVVCDTHGPITHLDCTELEFTTERGGVVYPRKSKAGRTVYPVTFEMAVW